MYEDETVALTEAAAIDADKSGAPPVIFNYALFKRLYAQQVALAAATAITAGVTAGAVPYNSLTYAANVTAGDTITIDGLVFQFKASGGAVTNDAYIGVVRGATGTLSYANLAAALNAAVGSVNPLVTNVATTGFALGNSTKKLLAVQVASGADAGTLYVYYADKAGGTKAYGSAAPSMAFSDALTESINWRYANLNLSVGAGFAAQTYAAHLRHVVTTADITLGTLLIPVPFIPKSWNLYAQTTAGLHLALPDVTITVPAAVGTQYFLSVKIDNSTGGAYVPLANTNVVFLDIYGIGA